MARRRSRISEFFEGFNQGYDTVNTVVRDKELNDITKAKPEESTGYTADQGDQLRAAAESGQYDIGVKTKDDGTFDSYTVTPKADKSKVGVIAQQGVTDFLGQRTAGKMNERQTDRARSLAMADVLTRSGDVQGGMKLRRDAQQSEREDMRFDREQKKWAQEDEADEKKKAYDSALQGAMQNLRFAKITGEHNEAMKKYVEDKKAYDEAKAAGKPVGVAPMPPVRGDYTPGDALADRAAMLDLKAQHGKLDDKSVTEFADLMQKVQGEGYARALKLAQSGAPVEEIAKAFNASGKAQIDPATTKIRTVKGKDGGPDSQVIEYLGPDGKPRTISVLAELEALDMADKVFTRHFQKKQDERADRADARDGARLSITQGNANREREDKKAEADARVAIYKENNPSATPAQLEAVRRGVLEAVPKASGIESDYKPDSYGSGGTVTQKDKNGNVTVTKIGPDGKPKEPTRVAPPGKAAAPAPSKPKVPANITQKDIKATAKKYGITEVEVKRRLGIE